MVSSSTMRHITSSTAADGSLESSTLGSPAKRSRPRNNFSTTHEPHASGSALVSFGTGGVIRDTSARQSDHAHDAHTNAGTDTPVVRRGRDRGSQRPPAQPSAVARVEYAGCVGFAGFGICVGLLDDADSAGSCRIGFVVG